MNISNMHIPCEIERDGAVLHLAANKYASTKIDLQQYFNLSNEETAILINLFDNNRPADPRIAPQHPDTAPATTIIDVEHMVAGGWVKYPSSGG